MTRDEGLEKTMDKAREFYINTVWHDNGDASHDIQQVFSDDDHTVGKLTNYTHVIEYSAYETLQARVQELEQSNKDLRHEMHMMMGSREKIQSLEARLKIVTDKMGEFGCFCEYVDDDHDCPESLVFECLGHSIGNAWEKLQEPAS